MNVRIFSMDAMLVVIIIYVCILYIQYLSGSLEAETNISDESLFLFLFLPAEASLTVQKHSTLLLKCPFRLERLEQ